MLTVHVRVSDEATGQPTPVRLRLIDADGVCRMPFGRLTEFATDPGVDVGGQVRLGDADFAYIDGICEVRLPPSPVRVEVSKGPEYLPVSREVVLGPGKIALRLSLERALDWHLSGWYSGDGRVQEMSPHAARLEGAAEGLDVVNLLAHARPPHGNVPSAFVNLLAFSGTQPALEGSPCVVVNSCNTHPVLGTVALLNCHRIVYPLRFGAPDGPDDWSIADWCDQCHRKKGLVVWPDLPRLTAEHPQGEALAALLLGKIDAFEVCRVSHVLTDWYRLLACGLHLPLMGSSGKDSNTVAMGAVRTYARLEPNRDFSYGAWIESVRIGRTFVTDGPLLSLTVNGQEPGSVLTLANDPRGAGQTVRIQAECRSVTPFARLECVYNGAGVAVKDVGIDSRGAAIDAAVPINGSGWLAARCLSGDGAIRAHTSPVYLQMEGQPLRPDAETIAPLLVVLDDTLTWVRREARCTKEQQREQLMQTLQAARQELLRRC